MNILFVAPYLPSPPNTGARRRVHGLMTNLARDHTVSILALVEPGVDHSASLAETRRYCAEAIAVPNQRFTWDPVRKRAWQLASVASPFSYGRLLHHQPAFQAALDRMIARGGYDVVTVESALLGYYRFPRDITLVLDEHNIEFDILRRTAAVESRWGRKAFNYLEYAKLRREERAIWGRFHGCALPSTRDEGFVRRALPAMPTKVVANGVDTAFFRPSELPPDPQTLVFFGVLSYYPNEDGILHFIDDILPLIRQRHPGVELLVIGPAPPASLAQRAGAGLTVTGLVDDVRPYLARAAAVVVPLRIGGGTRLKILEAMAMGKAIVSTPLGAEGLAARDNHEILLAATAADFAAQVGRLLDDASLAGQLGAASRALVERCYDWRAVATDLEELYRMARSGRGGGRPESAAPL